MLVDAVALVGGLALLAIAADRFVLAAARLASALRVSAVLVGAVVIGFGTSAPEFVVTILATVEGAQDIAFGNIVGSNIANLTLVLGAAGLATPLAVRHRTLRRELPLVLVATAALALATANRLVSLLDAVLLIAGAVAVLVVLVRTARADRAAAEELTAEVSSYAKTGQRPPRLLRDGALALVGLAGTIAGAQLVVTGATGIATALGISQAIIGLTVVAVGTSLPELGTVLVAARRSETDLVIGNVLGSNLFNALPVAGVAGMLDTVRLDAAFLPSLLAMVAVTLLAALFLRSGRRLARGEGAALLALFVAWTALAAVL